MMIECRRCGSDCDGSMMRTDPRFDRVRKMLAEPEMPITTDGLLELCHHCQRSVYFAGGLLRLLIQDLKRYVNTAWIRRAMTLSGTIGVEPLTVQLSMPMPGPLNTVTQVRKALGLGQISEAEAKLRSHNLLIRARRERAMTDSSIMQGDETGTD